jgi:hypothetical protein
MGKGIEGLGRAEVGTCAESGTDESGTSEGGTQTPVNAMRRRCFGFRRRSDNATLRDAHESVLHAVRNDLAAEHRAGGVAAPPATRDKP